MGTRELSANIHKAHCRSLQRKCKNSRIEHFALQHLKRILLIFDPGIKLKKYPRRVECRTHNNFSTSKVVFGSFWPKCFFQFVRHFRKMLCSNRLDIARCATTGSGRLYGVCRIILACNAYAATIFWLFWILAYFNSCIGFIDLKLDYVAQAYVILRVPPTCKGMQKCRKHSCGVNRSATKSKFCCFGCLFRDVNFDDNGQEEQNAFRDAHLDHIGFPKMYETLLCDDWCGRKRDSMDHSRV